ncbi:hypothetical protein BH10PSE14_BH10PSE14_40820 [soil metagenome]
MLAPWFRAEEIGGNPSYAFHTTAGREVVLLFFGSTSEERAAAALREVTARRSVFDDVRLCFFGISIDPRDVATGRLAAQTPGIRFFLDRDRAISMAYGATPATPSDPTRLPYHAHWLLLDRMLRVVAVASLDQGAALLDLAQARAVAPQVEVPAPALIVERVFEPELCRQLIVQYEAHGGQESGFMREENGRTVERHDLHHKIRRDHEVDDQTLCRALSARIHDRLVPMIARAFQFHATRMERYIVACYDSAEGGHFRAHRDNTTKGTAHRRFAVTINLNAGNYDGGDLCFPEFGERQYRAPTGGAIVFSCSLLHQAQPVTRGKRYAFLPFLYDDAAAAIRTVNQSFIGDGILSLDDATRH